MSGCWPGQSVPPSGFASGPGQSARDVLLKHLRDRRALLVLDNCEHLLGPCAALAHTLLDSCEGLVLVATSREDLRLPGEIAYRVPPLTVPAEASRPAVTQSDAARLFVDPPETSPTRESCSATLAQRLGIEAFVDDAVDLGDRPGAANAGAKVMTLVCRRWRWGGLHR